MKYIFVDAYNVINSWPELKDIKKYSLEASRKKLIEILQNYSSYKGYKIFIIFDAHLVPKSREKKERYGKNTIVIFTKEGETADSFIEKKINNMGRKINVCVVTSDLLEQQLVFQRGATRMSSLEFYYEVKLIKKTIKQNIEKSKINRRNVVEDIIDKRVLEKLQEIRRNN